MISAYFRITRELTDDDRVQPQIFSFSPKKSLSSPLNRSRASRDRLGTFTPDILSFSFSEKLMLVSDMVVCYIY
jgi:hypothetical protein